MTRQQELTDSPAPAPSSGSLSTADLVQEAPPEQDPGTDETALLDDRDSAGFRQRWTDVQSRFVDDPRAAVREADGLVAEVMQALAAGFAGHKGALEEQWSRDDEPDTEQLRQALQRYRSFFSRLLAT